MRTYNTENTVVSSLKKIANNDEYPNKLQFNLSVPAEFAKQFGIADLIYDEIKDSDDRPKGKCPPITLVNRCFL